MSALFRSASTSSFDKLYRQHAASVYRYLRAVLGNHADAEDVTQQVFLNAYRALENGTRPRRAENWLFTIAHNEARRHFRDTRGRKLEVELEEDDLASDVSERSGPSAADILRALQQLTPNQRSALVMREFEGRSYAEISRIMGMSQAALETLVFRARRALAEALEDGLTCEEAELALSRRLDRRLSRREARRLKAHMRECRVCVGFEVRQKRQRSLLRGLGSVIPVPVSLFAFRGEQAAAAAGGLTAGAAVTGGSAGVAAKAAAVVAAVTVAGGVGATTVRSDSSPSPQQTPVAEAVSAAPASTRTASVTSARVEAPARRAGARAPLVAQPRLALGKKAPKRIKPLVPARLETPASEVRHGAPPSKAKAQHASPKPKPQQAANPIKPTRPATARARALGKQARPPRPDNAARGKPTTPPATLAPGQEKKLLEAKPEPDPKPAKPEQAKS